jgi:uncharacterized protein
MEKNWKAIVYFDRPGQENTDEVLDVVQRRYEEGDISRILVATTKGVTGLKFAKAFKSKAEVVAISHEKIEVDYRKEMEEHGAKPLEKSHLPFHAKGMDVVRDALFVMGQGFKVALELALIATDMGIVPPYNYVIAVGGTGRGADTAIVVRTTTTAEAFTRDESKRLEVREILCMPLKKSWL